MATVAFLGLGQMGSRMAARLVGAGHDVTVWNRTRAKAEAVTGARVADTPGAAAAGSDIVITMLADPDAVTAVVDAMDLRSGTVLVEMSTIGPKALAGLKLPDGVGLVDAPVGGSIDKAETGELLVLVGGTDADVERVTPVLEVFGTVQHLGGPGSAAAAKLVVNASLIAGLALLGELRELAGELGVAAEPLLASGPLAAVVRRASAAGAHFTMSLAEKDLTLVTDHASGLPMTEAALTRIRALLPDAGARELGTLADPRTDPRRTDA